MQNIVDFNQKIDEFKKIYVLKKEDYIVITSRSGKITIYLVNEVEEKSIFNKLIEFIKNKGQRKYKGSKIIQISETKCQELIYKYLWTTSWKNSISESESEKIWLDIKQEIINCKYFQIDSSFSRTYTSSYIYEIK